MCVQDPFLAFPVTYYFLYGEVLFIPKHLGFKRFYNDVYGTENASVNRCCLVSLLYIFLLNLYSCMFVYNNLLV